MSHDFTNPNPILKEIAEKCPEMVRTVDDLVGGGKSRIATLTADLADARNKLAEAESEKDKWRLALEGLTPGGSEFVNDRVSCLAFIRSRKADTHDSIKFFKSGRDKAEARLKLAENVIRKYAEESNWGLSGDECPFDDWWNNGGNGYDLAADYLKTINDKQDSPE